MTSFDEREPAAASRRYNSSFSFVRATFSGVALWTSMTRLPRTASRLSVRSRGNRISPKNDLGLASQLRLPVPTTSHSKSMRSRPERNSFIAILDGDKLGRGFAALDWLAIRPVPPVNRISPLVGLRFLEPVRCPSPAHGAVVRVADAVARLGRPVRQADPIHDRPVFQGEFDGPGRSRTRRPRSEPWGRPGGVVGRRRTTRGIPRPARATMRHLIDDPGGGLAPE